MADQTENALQKQEAISTGGRASKAKTAAQLTTSTSKSSHLEEKTIEDGSI